MGTLVFSRKGFHPTRSGDGLSEARPPEVEAIVDNVLLPIDILRLNRQDFHPKAMSFWPCGVEGFEKSYPNELSGECSSALPSAGL